MKKRKEKEHPLFTEVTAGAVRQGFKLAATPAALEEGLYEALRANVPVVDAAISKLVRLTGGFKICCDNKQIQMQLEDFFSQLPVSVSGSSLNTFMEIYLDSLLTYGRAFGEILLSENTRSVSGLYCADCTLFGARYTSDPDGFELFNRLTGEKIPCTHPERILYTAANPTAKKPGGTSLLRGLPALSSILMRIYETVGQNFDRAGNVRYAVTYLPKSESEAAFAKERASEIAREWSSGMAASKAGNIKDFVAVGDVQIKVIGADGPVIDTEVPVRQLLEQLIAKLSIPPFLLGLTWSTTERMSSQQADILTSEIDYYRRLLTQPLMKIIKMHCDMQGIDDRVWLEWENVNLQDAESLARARLYNAQAAQIEGSASGDANNAKGGEM